MIDIKNINYYREDFCKQKHPEAYNIISRCYGSTHQQRLYNYTNNIASDIICPCCNILPVKFINIIKGYSKYCGIKCATQNAESKKKRIQTNIEKYGCENPYQNKEVQQKYKNSCLEKYNVTNPNFLQRVRDKIKNTNQKKYGVNTVLQLGENRELKNVHNWQEVRDKAKETIFKETGLYTKTGTQNWKDKVSKTVKEKYNEDISHYSQSTLVKQKKLDTNLQKIKNDFIGFEFISGDINKVVLKCPACDNIFEETVQFLRQRRIQKINLCTKCKPYGHTLVSQGHQDILNFIKQVYNKDIIINDRRTINGIELDLYLPDLKLAIEFNGLYYHCELFKIKNYHINKTIVCEQKGIKLIQIFEDEWSNKSEIVKSRILSMLGFSEKLDARKCIIKEVNTFDEKLFFNNTHIQGYTPSTYCYGLYFNGILVSCMSFCSRRTALGSKNNSEWELLRFSQSLNINVRGSFSKLLKHFTKNVSTNLITYCDRRWANSTNNVYIKNGFILEDNGVPNYWYIINNSRQHRFNFRKDKLVKQGYDKNKTEKDIMFERNIYRIYDCGNLKYKLQ